MEECRLVMGRAPRYISAMPRTLSHPAAKDISIDGVLHALSDPLRRQIVAKLMDCGEAGLSCSKACDDLSPSTISFHHKILREAGLIRSEKVGVAVINSLRAEELEKKFPGLLASIFRHHRPARTAAPKRGTKKI